MITDIMVELTAIFVVSSIFHILYTVNKYQQWREYNDNLTNVKLYLTWKEFITAFPFMQDSLSCSSNFLLSDFDEKETVFYQRGNEEKQVVIFSFLDYYRFKRWEKKNVKDKECALKRQEKELKVQNTLAFLQDAEKATTKAMVKKENIC